MNRPSFFSTFAILSILCAACGNGDDTTGTTSTGSGGGGGSSSSTGGGGTGGGGGSDPLCSKQHTETKGANTLVVCDEAFFAPPFVHLPRASATTDYMALRRCAQFVDRDGKGHDPTSALAKKLCSDIGADTDSRLHAFELYETTLDGTGKVTAFSPFAIIDEKNLLRPIDAAVAEGLVSKKNADGTFDFDPSIPIRVTFGHPKVMMTEKDGSTTYQVDATVDNLDQPVRASDGSCMPAVSSDPNDPFPGAQKVVFTFTRVPSMHLAGDDEGVFAITADGTSFGTVMAPTWFFGPESLFADLGPPAPYQGIGHGTPGAIPDIHLEMKHGSGAPCTP